MAALCGVLLTGGPALATVEEGASSDPPTKPELHPFRECSQYCDRRFSIVESTTPLLSAVSTDPDSTSLTYTFTIEDYMTDELLASEQLIARPGDEVSWRVPEGILTGRTTYRWNVTVRDGSSTVSNDKYFTYNEPESLFERARGTAAEAGFYVLVALPNIGVVVAIGGLMLLPWRLRAGLWMLVGGLAVAGIAVLILFQLLAGIGS